MDRPGGNVAICEVNLSSLIPMQETEPELKEAGEVPKAGSKRKGRSKGDGKESKDAQPKKRWKKTVLGQGTFMESSGGSQGKKKKAPNPKTALKQIKEMLNDKAMLPVPPPLPVPLPLPPPPSTPPPPPPPSPSPPLLCLHCSPSRLLFRSMWRLVVLEGPFLLIPCYLKVCPWVQSQMYHW